MFHRRWGYTDSEGRFLYLIATQSGYFVHKHYAEFLGIAPNKRTTALINKALKRGHIRERAVQHGFYRPYHLYSRRVYESLNQGNSSLRKTASVSFAMTRLMVTSFVVDNPEESYFTSDEEKIKYFTEVRGISLSDLPYGQFRNRPGQELLTRYFVEKFPIFPENEAHPNSPVIFTFFDTHFEGLTPSVDAFKSFLDSYRSLFQALQGNFRLLYVYQSDANLLQAEKVFQASFNENSLKPTRDDLLNYFRDKLNAEVMLLTRMFPSDVRNPREGSPRFAGQAYENLYQYWKESQTIPENALVQIRVCQPEFTLVYEPF